MPYPAIRQLLIQREVGEKRANWVTALQEYGVEIQPTKIVRGQGFCRMLIGASHLSAEEDQGNEVQIGERLREFALTHSNLFFSLHYTSPP